MTQNDTGKPLPTRQERAALLVATDDLPDEQIAASIGIGRKTLARWKLRADFHGRVEAHRAALAGAVTEAGLAVKVNRIRQLDRRWRKLRALIDERAADPTMQHVPGGKTGLLVRQVKVIGTGRNAQRVEEYVVDVGTLRELRAIEQQAAQECGQWCEKRESVAAVDLGADAEDWRDRLRAKLDRIMQAERAAAQRAAEGATADD